MFTFITFALLSFTFLSLLSPLNHSFTFLSTSSGPKSLIHMAMMSRGELPFQLIQLVMAVVAALIKVAPHIFATCPHTSQTISSNTSFDVHFFLDALASLVFKLSVSK